MIELVKELEIHVRDEHETDMVILELDEFYI